MILLTGVAGFIGFHTTDALLARGETVVGVDNINNYYPRELKQARLKQLEGRHGFTFYKADISDQKVMNAIIEQHPEIDRIIHLAAQAGVRYSLENPRAYEQSNLAGQLVMLELARHKGADLKHFVYASSSSVYGSNTKQPFSVEDAVNEPVSLYAATKRAGELMAQSYSHLYEFPATGLRFFTVYGPWGRPDMAYFLFTRAIAKGHPIKVFNHGDMKRDFTWIDDIVAGVLGATDAVPAPGSKYCYGDAPHRIFNLGNHKPETLLDLIHIIESALGKETEKVMEDMQPGDVYETYADIVPAQEIFGFEPKTPISEGIRQFVEWYKEFYKDAE